MQCDSDKTAHCAAFCSSASMPWILALHGLKKSCRNLFACITYIEHTSKVLLINVKIGSSCRLKSKCTSMHHIQAHYERHTYKCSLPELCCHFSPWSPVFPSFPSLPSVFCIFGCLNSQAEVMWLWQMHLGFTSPWNTKRDVNVVLAVHVRLRSHFLLRGRRDTLTVFCY